MYELKDARNDLFTVEKSESLDCITLAYWKYDEEVKGTWDSRLYKDGVLIKYWSPNDHGEIVIFSSKDEFDNFIIANIYKNYL